MQRSNVYIEERGRENDDVIVMVHGAGGSSATWFMQLRGLSKKIHTVALDLNGHGRTPDRNEDPESSYLADINSVVSQFDRPYLMGHSMGGALAQLYAIRNPEKIAGLVLVGTGAKLRVTQIIFDLLDNDFEGYLKMIAKFAFHPDTSHEIIEASIKEVRKCPVHVIRRDFEFCNEFNIMDMVENIPHRTLLIAADSDNLTPPKYLEYLHDKIRQSTLVIIPKAGHSMMLEQFNKFNDIVAAWIRSNE